MISTSDESAILFDQLITLVVRLQVFDSASIASLHARLADCDMTPDELSITTQFINSIRDAQQ